MVSENWALEWLKMTGRTPDRLVREAPKVGRGPCLFGQPVTTTPQSPYLVCECQVCGTVWVRDKAKGLPRRCPSVGLKHVNWFDGMTSKRGFPASAKPPKRTGGQPRSRQERQDRLAS